MTTQSVRLGAGGHNDPLIMSQVADPPLRIYRSASLTLRAEPREAPMSSSDVIAVVAVAISLVSAVAALLTYQRGIVAERRQRMPALVFGRDDANHSQLVIANVGTGPAMNIVYAQGRGPDPDGQIAIEEGFRETWFNPIHLRPIQPGEKVPISWEVKRAGLGLRYTDAFGSPYVVKASDHGMRIFEGASHVPDWSLQGMPYLWHVESSGLLADGPRWGECAPGERPRSSQLPEG